METLQAGSLNVNGMRDMKKFALLSEIINLKELNVICFDKRRTVIWIMKLIGDYGGRENVFLVIGVT